jgi:hypothetical protein
LITKEDLKKYIHQVARKNSYITREQIYNYCGRLYNSIDRALLILPYECVRGQTSEGHSFEEIRNLKMTDLIPEENAIIVTREPNDETQHPRKRAVLVDPRTMSILLAACKEEEYHKDNGQARGRFAVRPVKNSPYLIRTIERYNDQGDDRINIGNISSRFKNFRTYTGIKFLNPTIVFQSGLLDKCLRKEAETGIELTSEDFRQIYRDLELDERNWSSLKEMYEDYKNSDKSVVL